mgnify:FL=1
MEEIVPDKQTIESSRQHYSDDGLWDKLKNVARKAGIKVVWLVLVLYYTSTASTTPMSKKSIIYGTLGYFILPIDLIPDVVPVVGYSDDLTALVACVTAVASCITPEVKRQAERKLHDWFGDYDRNDIDGLVK